MTGPAVTRTTRCPLWPTLCQGHALLKTIENHWKINVFELGGGGGRALGSSGTWATPQPEPLGTQAAKAKWRATSGLAMEHGNGVEIAHPEALHI